MSPVNYLSKDTPPLPMIQGDKDTTIPVKHAYYMKQKADAVNAPVEIMIIKNAGHNWRKVDAEIKESYDYIKGFSKQIAKTPAELNLLKLPAGYGFQVQLRLTCRKALTRRPTRL